MNPQIGNIIGWRADREHQIYDGTIKRFPSHHLYGDPKSMILAQENLRGGTDFRKDTPAERDRPLADTNYSPEPKDIRVG